MYCARCGKLLPADVLFCDVCGERTPVPANLVEPPITAYYGAAPPKKRFPTILIIAPAAIVVAAVLCITVYGVIVSNTRAYVASVLEKSLKAYAKESETFIKRNAVLDNIRQSFDSSGEWQFRMDGMRATLRNDRRAKILSLDANIDAVSPSFALYLSDTRMALGIPGTVMAELDPKKLGTDLAAAVDNNSYFFGSSFNELTDVLTILDDYDFSYSSVTSGFDFITENELYRELSDLLKKQMKNLIARADYEKTRGEAEIGEKFVRTNQIKLTVNARAFGEWFERDLMPELSRNEKLEELYEKSYGLFGITPASMDYADFLEELEYSIEGMIENLEDYDIKAVVIIQVYKGVAVSLDVKLDSDDLNNPIGFVLSTHGSKYRLDDIRLAFYDESSSRYNTQIILAGDHFNRDTLTSALTVRNNYGSERVNLEWRLREPSNNLTIRYNGESLRFTLAAEDSGVNFRYENFRLNYGSLSEQPEMPSDTVSARDFEVTDLLNAFNIFDLLDLFY